jgi:outer membrane protein assembly factor BamB
MIQTLKRLAFLLLATACLAAAALLFLPAFREGEHAADPQAGCLHHNDAGTGSTHHTESANTSELVVAIPITAETPAPTVPAEAWNTYHGDGTLTGAVDTLFPPALVQSWQALVGGPVEQTPVAAGGRIYAVTDRATVIALDREGREVWKRTITPETAPGAQTLPLYVDAPLACFENNVFVGTDDGILTALYGDTGETAWHVPVDGYVHGTVNYQKETGSLFVLEQETGALLCLDMNTGALRWRSEGIDRADGSPAITAGMAVYGSCASALHLLSLKDGAHLHDIKIEEGGGQVAGGVAVADGFAYAGCRDGRVMGAKINEASLAWIQTVSKTEVFSTPAVKGEWVVVTSLDGMLHALDRDTGEPRWRHELGGEPKSPVIAGDKVVVTSDDGLFLVNLEDGARIWETRMTGFLSSPAVVGAMIVVGCEDGTVTAFTASSE